MNRRLWKEQYRDKAGQALGAAQRTYYLYSDEGLIAEAKQDIGNNAAAPQISTQYGYKPESLFTTAPLFIKTKNSAGQETTGYYHLDHLGTPQQITDKAGRVIWSASYDAFGRATITTPVATEQAPTIESNLRLPGQYEDSETGLHYNWNRYYDPATGRYISSDPIGLMGGINRFAYVSGRPLTYIDPNGEFAWIVIGGLIGGGWSALQKWSDPCASTGDIWLAFAGGAFSGALGAYVPITRLKWIVAAGRGAAAGAGGNIGSQLISNGGNVSNINWGSLASSTAYGLAGGIAGNFAGLSASISGVRQGVPTQTALEIGDGIGTGVSVFYGGLDSAAQTSFSNNSPCDCGK